MTYPSQTSFIFFKLIMTEAGPTMSAPANPLLKAKRTYTAEQFYALATKLDSRNLSPSQVEVERQLFDSKVTSKGFTKYLVGKEKVEFYGNALLMSSKSMLLKNDKSIIGETHILTDMSATQYPDQLINMWSYLNGIAPLSWINTVEEKSYLKLDEAFYVIELHTKLGVSFVDIQNDKLWLAQKPLGSVIANHVVTGMNAWQSINRERLDQIIKVLNIAMDCASQGNMTVSTKLKAAAAAAIQKVYEI